VTGKIDKALSVGGEKLLVFVEESVEEKSKDR
jgi:hypothetical protein